MPDDFVSAKPSPLVTGLFRRLLPVVLPHIGVVGVDYDEQDLEKLRALSGERVLLTPNHPTNNEPALLFHLSAAVQQPFFYLACREAFEPLGGLWGEVIRRVGAFSVVRGTADRASFRATRQVLARPASKTVIFPEGEVYSQNDTLLPFHSGVFQLAFWALEELRKGPEPDASLYIVPVAIKYRFVADMNGAIALSLDRLEKFTGVPAETNPASWDPYTRLRRIGEAMLASLEREYRLPPPPKDSAPPGTDLTPRLNAIKEAILLRVAAAAGVALPKGETLPERMRALIYVIETVTREEPSAATPYDTRLRRQQRDRSRPLLRDLERLANWIAVHDGYVRAEPTPERMADTLIRLERECFGEAKISGPRRCRLRIGEALNLRDCWEGYQANRRAEVARVTHEVERRVSDALRHRASHSVDG